MNVLASILCLIDRRKVLPLSSKSNLQKLMIFQHDLEESFCSWLAIFHYKDTCLVTVSERLFLTPNLLI